MSNRLNEGYTATVIQLKRCFFGFIWTGCSHALDDGKILGRSKEIPDWRGPLQLMKNLLMNFRIYLDSDLATNGANPSTEFSPSFEQRSMKI